MANTPAVAGWLIGLSTILISVLLLYDLTTMLSNTYLLPPLSFLVSSISAQITATNSPTIDLNWYPPNATQINDLSAVINGKGVYGFVFNDSNALLENAYYGGYNWCNMPHVKRETYPRAVEGYTLEYVEVIHRHHKRTPYAANTFPRESYAWNCDDEGLFYYGKPLNSTGNSSAHTYWSVYTSASNPFAPAGFNGTCQFPQITRQGLDDSFQHGKDLYDVYGNMLGFLPQKVDNRVSYRVTNNVITSQVAGMVVEAMYQPSEDIPLRIQPASIDSLEPTYPCKTAIALFGSYGVGSNDSNWTAHLNASASLYKLLDNISGVAPNNTGFHQSWDHYFDNLSARLCHQKALPCKNGNSTVCVTQALADAVFRLGEYEYSYIYRDARQSLQASVASYGVYIAELAQNIRASIAGSSPVVYRHNVAHDGSIARLLSILQIDVMVWPGTGSELVFEVWNKGGERFARVLWGGNVLRSSNPGLGSVDMLPVEKLLGYFDGLVGIGASKVPGLCGVLEH